MTWLVQHASFLIVVLSALGAAVMSAVVVAYGFTPPRGDDDDRESVSATDPRALLTMRLGHAMATLCFALIVVLAILAQLRPAAPRVAADQQAEIARLRAEVERVGARLRETVASVDDKLAASGSRRTADKDQSRPMATVERAEQASAPPPRPPAQAQAPSASPTAPTTTADRPGSSPTAPSARRTHRDQPTAALDVPATPSRTRPLTPAQPPVPPVSGRLGRLVTTVGDVRVEVNRNTEGAEGSHVTAYTARLSDTSGRPLVASDVVLVGRMADGSRAAAALDPTPTPGVYSALVAARPEGPHNLVLQVKLETLRLEVPLD